MGDAAIPQLEIGQKVGQWTVEKKLGEGGFGGVYRVSRGGAEKYAMKIESAKDEIQCLKMDVMVLDELSKKGGRHFCRIDDRGRNPIFNFLVMTLVGQSMSDLRKACPGQHFSLSTALSAGTACLEAVEDMHGIGYLHRDIKPANFAIGREESGEQRKVFVLDFGMCRRYINKEGRIRTPRRVCGFRGTIRYAPLSCHLGREMSRKDDVEIWLYQQVEITVGRLPWYNCGDKDEVQRWKERVRGERGIKEMCAGCPREYVDVLKHVDSLKYFDQPNYNMIYDLMKKAMANNNCKASDPFDWEKGGHHYGQTQMLPPPVFDPHRDAGGYAFFGAGGPEN